VVEELPLASLAELAALNAHGGLPAAEAWAWHRHRLAADGARYDPRVALRIRRGASISAADHIELIHARAAWIASLEDAIAGFDALLSPTVPMLAPPIAPLVADDDAFFAVNARLLRNPAVVNFLDGCAISMPCQRDGDWPVGLMVWGLGGADDTVLGVASSIELALGRPAAARGG
jgi:aspartyl-tRNA(Asn)/glutamyl-tRNA(Gln) amidotransferase subunit A